VVRIQIVESSIIPQFVAALLATLAMPLITVGPFQLPVRSINAIVSPYQAVFVAFANFKKIVRLFNENRFFSLFTFQVLMFTVIAIKFFFFTFHFIN
jgi:hypothetical protein